MAPYQRITYDSTKLAPFAQVTVMNASHGDSNLIDLYQNDAEQGREVRRVLIDTGPGGEDRRKAILDAIDDVAIPRPTNANPKPDPFVPPLAELQVTHVDTDHIGNAAELTKALKSRIQTWSGNDAKYKCSFVFPHVPEDEPNWELDTSWKQAQFCVMPQPQGGDGNAVTVRFPMNLLEWARDLSLLGYWIKFSIDSTANSLQDLHCNVVDKKMMPTSTWAGKSWTGIEWAAMKCIYNQAFWKRRDKLKLRVTMEIFDVFRPDGRVSIHIRKFPQRLLTLNETCIQWQNALPANYPGQVVTPPIPTPSTKDLATHNTQFMRRLENNRPLRDLGYRIQELINDNLPCVETLNPLQGKQQSYPMLMGTGTGCAQFYVSPSVDVFRDLARFLVTKDTYNVNKIHVLDTDNTVTNRASVVTVFHRTDLDMKMIFTGDAYDQHCDIRKTVFNYVHKAEHSIRTDVLKIPHHGSEKTVASSFYELVRADVYLVCASHEHSSANPRLSTLVSIAKGFIQGPKRTSEQPYRIYFSFPDILKDFNGRASAAAALITSLWGPTQNSSGEWSYEMYRPKRADFGRILFGKDIAKGGLHDIYHHEDWVICHTWGQSAQKAVVNKD